MLLIGRLGFASLDCPLGREKYTESEPKTERRLLSSKSQGSCTGSSGVLSVVEKCNKPRQNYPSELHNVLDNGCVRRWLGGFI
ncbi:Acyltransferase [Operophtera brumata]|uniref:Acyltransferase n=1 Tax=Operophtera brumata TaxID=104452 RepID=A0A0L7KMJ7_OPEBR|nr:Acyltransferase [Operophtera brumata]